MSSDSQNVNPLFDEEFWRRTLPLMKDHWEVTQKLRKFAHLSQHQVRQNTPRVMDHLVIALLGASYGDEGKGKLDYFIIEMSKYKTYDEFMSHMTTDFKMPAERAQEVISVFVDPKNLVASGKITIQELYSKFVSRTFICIRDNGGPNAGHTIIVGGKKMATHAVPSGIMYSESVLNFIGRGCYVSYEQLLGELNALIAQGINVRMFLSKKAFVITPEHVAQDKANEADLVSGKVKAGQSTANGSTKSGIGPCGASKYGRTGIHVDHPDWVNKFASLPGVILVDNDYLFYKEIERRSPNGVCFLFEGAQGFALDPDFGQYPFVTSSHCGYNFVAGSGVNPNYERIIVMVGKLYDTYVGALDFQESVPFDPTDSTDVPNPDATRSKEDPMSHDRKLMRCLVQVQHDGGEKGTTTGRWRQANFLNIRLLIEALVTNGANIWVCNKGDILKQMRQDMRQAVVIDTDVETGENIYIDFEGDFGKMIEYINTRVTTECPNVKIVYSESPEYV